MTSVFFNGVYLSSNKKQKSIIFRPCVGQQINENRLQTSQRNNDSRRFQPRSWPNVPGEANTIAVLGSIQVELLHSCGVMGTQEKFSVNTNYVLWIQKVPNLAYAVQLVALRPCIIRRIVVRNFATLTMARHRTECDAFQFLPHSFQGRGGRPVCDPVILC